MFYHAKTSEKSIKYISLDVDNPRLIGYKRRGSFGKQSEIVKILVENYEVIDICKSILNNGFHPDEILIIIPKSENSRGSIVVEGNRRLCACKILLNPDIIKGTTQYFTARKFKNHPNYELVIKFIDKLNVVELPGRIEAASYLASKHTQIPIKGWSVYTQGAYYLGLKSAETKLSELRSKLNDQVSLTRIKQVVFFYQLSEYILDMECWTTEELSYLVKNIDNLKIEAIIRLISSSDFKTSIGIITIDDKGILKASGFSQEGFNRVMERLARDAHFNEKSDGSSVISTRQENKTEIRDYLEELADVRDTTSSEDEDELEQELTLSGAEVEDDNGEAEDTSVQADPKSSKRGQRKWTRLISESTPSPTSMPKLADLIDEAKKLNVTNYKYSSMLLARSIMEIMLKIRIKENNLEKEIKDKYREKSGDFENILRFSLANIRNLSDDASVQKAIKNVIEGLLTRDKEILNLTNHNEIQVLSEKDVLHVRSAVQTFANAFLNNAVE